ncbi:MAG: hypothetical protein ACREU5_11795, partial [Burkholderiales bacterium]
LAVVIAVLLAAAVLALLPRVWAGSVPQLFLLEPLPGLVFGLRVERLGLALAGLGAAVWLWASVRAPAGPRDALQALALVGTAFAANVPTLALFAGLLTIVRPARLALLWVAGLVLAAAMVASLTMGGTLEFLPGGIAPGAASAVVRALLAAAYLAGLAAWAVAPARAWPRAAAALYAALRVCATLFGAHL